jgi:hypothetical protein
MRWYGKQPWNLQEQTKPKSNTPLSRKAKVNFCYQQQQKNEIGGTSASTPTAKAENEKKRKRQDHERRTSLSTATATNNSNRLLHPQLPPQIR